MKVLAFRARSHFHTLAFIPVRLGLKLGVDGIRVVAVALQRQGVRESCDEREVRRQEVNRLCSVKSG